MNYKLSYAAQKNFIHLQLRFLMNFRLLAAIFCVVIKFIAIFIKTLEDYAPTYSVLSHLHN